MRSPFPRGLRWLAVLGATAALPLLGAGAASASSPPAPVGCSAVTVPTLTQATPVAIPTGPAVVTSTIDVAGAPTSLLDVDVTTFITHTSAADMDITLTSPAGTVVTMSTDNGAGNDNVFNGTVWDDDANPAGALPYATNNGVVSDHAYVDLTTASPLVPEEAFGAFIGEDPNGTWTLTVSDDLAGEGGSIDSWSLDLTATGPRTLAAAGGTMSVPAPVAIADVAVSTSTIDVSGAATIADVDLTTNITHTFAADMDISVTSPAGTIVTLSTDNGAGNDNVFNGTVWDDDANPAGAVPYTTNSGVATDHAYANLTLASPLVPEEALAAFIGEDPNGTWTLTISDDLAGDVGSFTWGLAIQTAGCSADLSTSISDSPDPVAYQDDVTYDVTVANNGPGDAADTTVSLPLPAGTTIVSATPSAGGLCTAPAVGEPGTVECSWSSPTAAAASRTVQVVATAAGTAGAIITATATASSSTPDPDAANNAASTETFVAAPDLVTTITDSPDPVALDGTLTYDVTVTNEGSADAAGTSVELPLPAQVRFTSATPSVDGSCTTPAAGASGTVSCTWSSPTVQSGVRTVQVAVVTPFSASLSATATASTTTAEADQADNAATATTTVGSGAPPVGEDGRICTIVGTSGPDVLTGTAAVDVICGLAGDDTITGLAAGDFADGGDGADTIVAVSGATFIFGGLGNDRITGGTGVDKINGGAGDDIINGNGGADRITSGLGNDRSNGGAGNDVVTGGAGNDVLTGGAGNDRVTAGAGADRVFGGSGRDIVVGGTGNDRLDGGSGADRLSGEAGHDRIAGGAGNDRLSGGTGRDLLIGGLGLDLVHGGAGVDTGVGVGDVYTLVEIHP